MKKALITGVTGQDGAYLADFLIGKGYQVFGTFRRTSTPNFWRLHYLDIHNKVHLIPGEISDSASIANALKISEPDEVYHLAAQSFVGVSFSQPIYTSNITGISVTRMLDEIKKFNKKIKFYQASSSELYGDQNNKIQNELTNFKPSSPYAISKLYAFWMTNMYRKSYDMYAVNGILFNHESSIRGLEFVTRKISNGVAKISLGLTKNLHLGNMSAKRDWGYAPEFVEGMWLMLQQKNPDDYVLSTGENHSVQEFVNEACKIAGISTTKITSTKDNLRPFDVENLKGDNKKAIKKLGWKPKIKFKKLVKIMVEEDMSRWERWLKGEQFPWDASMAEQDILAKHK